MKKISNIIVFMLLVATSYIIHSCTEKVEVANCKTCKAFGNGGSVTEKQVCSDDEEAAFRNENAGKEIMCR